MEFKPTAAAPFPKKPESPTRTTELMSEDAAERIRESGIPFSGMVDAVYRSESRRVFAVLIRVLGDFDFAEGMRGRSNGNIKKLKFSVVDAT